jgi:rubredoxin
MAKKTRRLGQKLCPSCNRWIKGTRWKTCPHCGHEFQPKQATAAEVVVVAEAPAAVEKPAKNGNVVSLEQIRKVAATVKAMGGFQRMTEVLEVVKEAGGVKKFKDLAEAIACPESGVVVIEPVVID